MSKRNLWTVGGAVGGWFLGGPIGALIGGAAGYFLARRV